MHLLRCCCLLLRTDDNAILPRYIIPYSVMRAGIQTYLVQVILVNSSAVAVLYAQGPVGSNGTSTYCRSKRLKRQRNQM